MGKDDVSVKKRRKLHSSTSTETPKQIPVDVYKVIMNKVIMIIFLLNRYECINTCFVKYSQNVVEFEESEAQLRSAVKDANLYKKICQDLRQIFSNIAELKANNSEDVS